MAAFRLRPTLVVVALACAADAVQAGQPTVCDVRGDAPVVAVPVAIATAPDGADDCIVQPQTLQDAAWSGAAIVDARVVAGLRNPWIPGASTPTRAALAAAAFGDARTVLVGNARDVPALASICRDLRARGATGVRVLAGGIEAWRRRGLPLGGDARSLDRPVFVGATELERIAAASRAHVVFDAAADAALQALGEPGSVAGRRESRADAARRIARQLERAGVAPGVQPVTVVVADRAVAADWRAAWNATRYPDPLFYAGRDADYRLAVERGERIAADRYKPLPGPCDR